MTIIYPEPRSIVQVGTVDIQIGLTTRNSFLDEYGIFLRVDVDKFFKDFLYKISPTGRIEAAGLAQSSTDVTNPIVRFLDWPGISNAMQGVDNAHFQLGSKYHAMRHAFPLTCKSISLPPLHGTVGGYRNIQGNASMRLYAVFFDSNGYPVSHWFNPDDNPDQISLLYEFFGDGLDTFLSSFEVYDKLEKALGLPQGSLNTMDPNFPETLLNVISGPLYVSQSGTFDNAVMLQSSLPRIKGISSLPKGSLPNIYYEDATPIAMPVDGLGSSSKRVNLVRASTLGISTLVFASISDDLTSNMGLTDTVALMLYRPMTQLDLGPGLGLKGIAPEFASPDLPRSRTDIIFKDTLLSDPNSSNGKYVTRKVTAGAACMHFPAFQTSPCGVMINISNLHKAMPKAPLGIRMLQLFSAAVDAGSKADGTEDILPGNVMTLLDIKKGLGKRLDLSREPQETHSIIIETTETYLQDENNRAMFIAEFVQKFPGLLETFAASYPIGTPVRIKDAIVASLRDVSLVINTNMSVETRSGVTRIDNIPIVFQLTK